MERKILLSVLFVALIIIYFTFLAPSNKLDQSLQKARLGLNLYAGPNKSRAQDAIKMLYDSYMLQPRAELLLEMARIYHYGLPGLPPDPATSKKLYDTVLVCFSNDKWACLQAKESREFLAKEYPFSSKQFGQNDLTPITILFPPEKTTKKKEQREPLNILPVTQQPATIRHRTDVIRNDFQNVHDHVLNRTTSRIFQKIGPNNYTHSLGPTQMEKSVMYDTLKEKAKGNENAIRTLDVIFSHNAKIGSLDAHEIEILSSVYKEIETLENSRKSDAYDNLIINLNECIEHDQPVCAQGRAHRVISTLQSFKEDTQNIKPAWALRQEMLNTAANIREKMGLEGQDLKDAINVEFKKNYVDQGILTEDEMNVELSEWIDEV